MMQSTVSNVNIRTGLHVETTGESRKPALILLNSLGTTLQMWDQQIEALSAHFYIVRMDTRGHGKSPTDSKPLTLQTLGQDVIEVMDSLLIDKAFVCGISMGGITALWLGLKHPERFHRVIAANTAARIGTAEAWLNRASAVRTGGTKAMLELAQSAPQRWFTPGFTKRAPDAVESLCCQLSHTDSIGYAQCCEALATADIRNELSEFSIPLCVVTGEEDPVTTPADAEYIRQCVVGAEIRYLRASHLSNVEQPAAFNRVLLDFFT